MTLAILARAFWLTYRSLRYRDTVLTATPARSATVAMFGFRFILGNSARFYQETPKAVFERVAVDHIVGTGSILCENRQGKRRRAEQRTRNKRKLRVGLKRGLAIFPSAYCVS